jgi:predicted nucleic acid-binding protein
MYLDSAYIAKFYLNEPDSGAVRSLIATADALVSSSWALAEVPSVFHRHMREGSLNARQFRELLDSFLDHVEGGVWTLIPVGEHVLRRVVSIIRALPRDVHLRAGDALHLATASDADEREIWTNDRRLLAAADHVGLAGRHV